MEGTAYTTDRQICQMRQICPHPDVKGQERLALGPEVAALVLGAGVPRHSVHQQAAHSVVWQVEQSWPRSCPGAALEPQGSLPQVLWAEQHLGSSHTGTNRHIEQAQQQVNQCAFGFHKKHLT